MKDIDVIMNRDDILQSWAYILENMDLPYSECPVYMACDRKTNVSCYDTLRYTIENMENYEKKKDIKHDR